MVEQIMESKDLRCIYRKNGICYAKKGASLQSYCKICTIRIENLNTYFIKNRFNLEEFSLERIPFRGSRNIRTYLSSYDDFADPHLIGWREHNHRDVGSLRDLSYIEGYNPHEIRFIVFSYTHDTYYSALFKLDLSDLPEFIWYLEECGYSEKLLSKFKENILNMEAVNKNVLS